MINFARFFSGMKIYDIPSITGNLRKNIELKIINISYAELILQFDQCHFMRFILKNEPNFKRKSIRYITIHVTM